MTPETREDGEAVYDAADLDDIGDTYVPFLREQAKRARAEGRHCDAQDLLTLAVIAAHYPSLAIEAFDMAKAEIQDWPKEVNRG
jgi:hypothetical protein